MSLNRWGGAIAIFQGLGLLSLTLFFGVLFPGAGVARPEDFTDPAKYLPVVAAHPLWFTVPAWVHGLVADTLFVITLVALWRRLGPPAAIGVGFGALALTIYLMGHVVNTTWTAALIDEFRRGGDVAAQFRVASSFYSATMMGGSLFMGASMVALAAPLGRLGRGLGWAAAGVGAVDVVAFFHFIPVALPLSGALCVWLGIALFREDAHG